MERLIYRGSTSHHPVEVSEEGTVRNLRFGTEERQSSVDLADPAALQLSYTRWMMTALLLVPQTERFLICGLGGGAIPHFLHHHFPDSSLQIVEREERVIHVARNWFQLPDHPLVQVIHQDVIDYLALPAPEPFDVVFLDLYDAQSMAPALYLEEFYTRILERVHPQGVVAVNLWNGNSELYTMACSAISASCKGAMVEMAVKKRSNSIVLAFPSTIPKDRIRSARKNLGHWQNRFDLPFHTYFKRLRRENKKMRSFSDLF